MNWKMVFVMIVAAGSLTATAVRADENAADRGATAKPEQTARSHRVPYGAYVEGPATSDANGTPVAKPNPMSRYLDRARELGSAPVEMPLVDDFRTDGTATDGQTK
jgi:hypothetical protein